MNLLKNNINKRFFDIKKIERIRINRFSNNFFQNKTHIDKKLISHNKCFHNDKKNIFKTKDNKDNILNTIKNSTIKNRYAVVLKSVFGILNIKGDYNLKLKIGLAVILLILSKYLNVKVPFYFKTIMDEMNNFLTNNLNTLQMSIGLLIVSYALARFFSTFFAEIKNMIVSSVAQSSIRKVSYETFLHFLNMSLKFHLTKNTGELTKTLERGTKGISYILTASAFHVVPVVFEVILVSGILAYKYGLIFSGFSFFTIIAYFFFTIKMTVWRSRFRKQVNIIENQAASIANESLTNYESIKYFNNEKYQASKYDFAIMNYQKKFNKLTSSLSLLNIGQNFIFSITLSLMMYLSCKNICHSFLAVSDLVLINQLFFQLSVPLNFLGSIYRDIKQSLLDLESLIQIRNTSNEIDVLYNKKKINLIELKSIDQIKFENVTFGYNPLNPVLKNVSFTINKKDHVAFVGSSGCGKSTILKLIFRFYNVDQGKIYINGYSLDDISLHSLRKLIGCVPQDIVLFNDTIYENIKFGRFNALTDEINKVINLVLLDDLIKKNVLGYNTLVGERGLMISGGEKQRIAFARVILKKPSLVFLDESTSALDTYTEKKLYKNISNFFNSHDCTRISIAHKLKLVADADKIFVLNNGRIIEEGKHNELLKSNSSFYYNLFKEQEGTENNSLNL